MFIIIFEYLFVQVISLGAMLAYTVHDGRFCDYKIIKYVVW